MREAATASHVCAMGEVALVQYCIPLQLWELWTKRIQGAGRLSIDLRKNSVFGLKCVISS